MEVYIFFNIVVRVGKTEFPLTVDHFYSSAQIERFRIYGHHGPVILEKRLLIPGIKWKFISGKVMSKDKKLVGDVFAQVATAIDAYLKERNPEMKFGHQVPKPGRSLLARQIPAKEHETLTISIPWPASPILGSVDI